MSGWIAMHRGEEAETLQERHPSAWLLLCQIGRRARWKREVCSITGLSFGQAMIGDWKRAGLQSEKSYRHAMGVLKRAGLVAFKGANKGTVATLVSTSIFTLTPDCTGEQTAEQAGGQGGTVKGERRGGLGATKNNGNKVTPETRDDEDMSGTELFDVRSVAEDLPKANSFEVALAEIRENWPANAMTRFRKAEVLKALRKLGKAGLPPAGTFQRSLEAWKACGDWTKDGGQFVKSAHLWISSGMWESPPVQGEGGGLTDEERRRRVGGRWDPLTEDELAAQLGPRGATGEFGY